MVVPIICGRSRGRVAWCITSNHTLFYVLVSLPYTNKPAHSQQRQTPSHSDAIPDNIQLAAHDLLPPYSNLNHSDISALGQHEHLDIEDPAFRVHVRYDVRQRRPGEELEATLRVFNARGRGWCHDAEQEVEGVHEEVAKLGALRSVSRCTARVSV